MCGVDGLGEIVLLRSIFAAFLTATAAFAQYFEGTKPDAKLPFTTFNYTWFAVGYSENTHTPIWTAYEVENCGLPKEDCKRPSTFKSEPVAETVITHKDYSNSGYSRGHMVPNAAMAYCCNCNAATATFITSNIVPQLQDHNGGVWERLESEISGLKSSSGFRKGLAQKVKKLWVYTGPVFFGEEKEIKKISNKNIWVPTHTWKTAIWQDRMEKFFTCSWLIPHKDGIEKAAYMDYVTSIEAIHAMCGVNVLGGTSKENLYSRVDSEAYIEIIKQSLREDEELGS